MAKPRKSAKAAAEPQPAPPARGRRRSTRLTATEKAARKFVIEAARLAQDLHCADILVLDVRGLSDISDYILITTGTSDRQIRSVGQRIEDMAKETAFGKLGRDIDIATSWLVLDFVDVVVHLFAPEARAHYDLEMMWGDAPRVRWARRKA